jgi:hypothetical protein
LSTDSRSCYRRAMGPSGLLTGSGYSLRIHRSCQRRAKKVGESSYKRTSVGVHPVAPRLKRLSGTLIPQGSTVQPGHWRYQCIDVLLSLGRTCRRGCWQVSVRVTFSSR